MQGQLDGEFKFLGRNEIARRPSSPTTYTEVKGSHGIGKIMKMFRFTREGTDI